MFILLSSNMALIQRRSKAKNRKQSTVQEDERPHETRTKLGYMEDIEWGWAAHERRERRAYWFNIWDGVTAIVSILYMNIVAFSAAFSPYNKLLWILWYFLDIFSAVDICIRVWRYYAHDMRNPGLRHGRSRLFQYLGFWFIIDLIALVPTDILTVIMSSYYEIPFLALIRCNRLLCGYKVFRYLNFLESHVGANMVAIRSLYYTILSWTTLHFTACIWYMIPCASWSVVRSNLNLCSAPSWIYSGTNASGIKVQQDYNIPAQYTPNKELYAAMFDHGLGVTSFVNLNATITQRWIYSLVSVMKKLLNAFGANKRPNSDIPLVFGPIHTPSHVVKKHAKKDLYNFLVVFSVNSWPKLVQTKKQGEVLIPEKGDRLGDIHGSTLGEKAFALFCQLEGTLVLYGLIQGGITSMLTNFDVNQFRYKMRVAAIINYLRDQNQPSELVRDVIFFYRYLWESSRGILSAGLFDQLPFALRSEISMELSGQIFDRSPLFQNINASFLRMLSLKFRPMLALPDQIIMKRGELSNLMVYVQKGELEVLSDDENQVPVILLKYGTLFGEINLITRMPRKYSIRAIAHCDLVVLRTEDLMDCLQSYPEIADELRQRAEERAGVATAQTQEGILANAETNESAKEKKQEKDLAAKFQELEHKMGTNMRALMSALKIRRPQETMRISDTMALYRIRDPMEQLVEYYTSSFTGRMKSNYRRIRQLFMDFSIDPDGLFYFFWERLIVVIITATFFLNTFVAFFESYNNLLDNSTGYVVLTFSYMMDLFLMVDFGLSFFTQIITANGKISDHRSMVKAYMTSWRFYADLMALFPLEIGTAFVTQRATETASDIYIRIYQMLAYLKLNRCLKIAMLPRFFDKLCDELTTSTASVRTVKFVLYICISCQVGAVILYAGTCNPETCPYDYPNFWTSADPPKITTDSSYQDRFITSLYYSVALLTTVGYGDIFPHNMTEQIVANIVMLMGLLVFGYCIAVLTATLANLDGPRVEFQDRLFALKKFMEFNKMSEAVKKRALDSVALLWIISKGEDVPGVKSMTADLPEHLTEEIQVEDLIHLVASVPIFKNLEEHILKSFAPAIRRYLFPPGEYIIQHGDLINELFIIRRGVCQIFHPDDTTMVIGELMPGMYFGEIGFLFNHNEIVSVKTVTHCEVLTIPRPAFDKAASSVRWFSHQMKLIGQSNKYYEDMCSAARNAKAVVKKRRDESPVRLSKGEKRRLRFKDDFNLLNVNPMTERLYKLLMNVTFEMDGRFLKIWEYIRLVESTVVFMFSLAHVNFEITETWYLGVMYLFDVYALVDIYIKLHVQYYSETNIVVTHPYKTARRYLSSNFWIDVLGVMPFEVIVVILPNAFPIRHEVRHWIAYLRLNRLLQIYRVPLAFSFLESDIKRDQSTTFILKFINYFLIFVMFTTAMPLTMQCPPLPCGINITMCSSTQLSAQDYGRRSCVDTTFLESQNITGLTDPWTQFVAEFYWAVTTTAVVGFGDFFAANGDERILFLVSMLAGYIFFGYIIACIAAAQANSDAKRSRFFDRLMAIKQYMNHEHLHKSLKLRIVRYYEYLWLRTQGTDPQTLIVGLPPSLTAELALQLYRKVIESSALFKTTPIGFKKMLAAIIRPLYVMEGEYVIKIDDSGSDLFFVFRGSIEVHYTNGVKSPQLVRAGRMLGENSFFTNTTSKISCRANENSDLYYVTRSEFDMILEHYPAVREKLLTDVLENMDKDEEYKMNTTGPRMFQHRGKRGGYRDSLAAVRKKKLPWRQNAKMVFRHIFRSDARFIRFFSKFTVGVLRVLSVMLILYQPAFADYAIGFYVIHYLLECVFLVNCFLQLRTGYLDEYGNEVRAPNRIRQQYIKRKTGLLLDVLVLFPYEVFALAGPDEMQPKLWAYLQLVRVPGRIYRIFAFFRKWLAELDINVLFVRLTYSFTQLFLWLHLFTCIAYYIACPDGTCNLDMSWIKHSGELAADHSPIIAYVVSLYFIVTTATTTGYGDIVPENNGERIFICSVQVVGKFLFGIIVGDIASTLANLQISRQNFESKFQAVKVYLLDQKAGKSIIDRVQKYYDYLWTIDRGVEDTNTVLNDAPYCLRTEICFAVHNKDLRELALFRHSSDAFIRMISASLHQVQFVPGDYIIQQGDLVEEMYFLHRGEAVEVEHSVEISVLRRGSNVNWQTLLIDWPASRTVRATDNCEVYVLSRSDLKQVVAKYKDEMGHVCTTNRIRLRDLLEEERVELD